VVPLFLAATLAAAFGCTVPGETGVEVTPEALRIAIYSDPLTLDPHRRNEAMTFSVLSNLYEGLTTIDAEMRVGPRLAERWENPDELTWRFHLRPDVTFHDGSPLTADDVVASLERARYHPSTDLSSYLVEVTQVRRLDDHTVEVVTARPYAILLNKLAFIQIVPADAPTEITEPIGTGPYRFVSFTPGDRVVLEAYPEYWGGPSVFDRVELVTVLDGDDRVDGLLAGRFDIAIDLKSSQMDRADAVEGFHGLGEESLVVEYLQLGVGEAPFDDVRVRQAISLALDRDRLVDVLVEGNGVPATQMVGRFVFGFVPGLEPPRRDLDRARALLAEAGFPDGFQVELEMREGRDGTEIARQLAEVGIEVELVVGPWRELYERLDEAQVPFYYGGFLSSSADASDIFDALAHTRDTERGYGRSNFGRYSDPELDRLIEESGTALDMMRRRDILQESMRRLADGYAFVPMVTPNDLYAMRDEIAWRPGPAGWVHAHEIGISPQAPMARSTTSR